MERGLWRRVCGEGWWSVRCSVWEGELCRWVCGVYGVCGGVCRVHAVRGVWRGVCTQSGWRVVVCRCVWRGSVGCVCGGVCVVYGEKVSGD